LVRRQIPVARQPSFKGVNIGNFFWTGLFRRHP
jgi:hypothetical protein